MVVGSAGKPTVATLHIPFILGRSSPDAASAIDEPFHQITIARFDVGLEEFYPFCGKKLPCFIERALMLEIKSVYLLFLEVAQCQWSTFEGEVVCPRAKVGVLINKANGFLSVDDDT